MSDRDWVIDRNDELGDQGAPIVVDQIEAALAKHPEVLQSVVVRNYTLGKGRLVAYVVVVSGGLKPGELEAHLSQTLPANMLPHHIVFLSSLPLAPDGQLDRAALSGPYPAGSATFTLNARARGATQAPPRASPWVPASGAAVARPLRDNQECERKPTPTPNGVTGAYDSRMEPVHRLIERRAESCPDAIAAVHEGKSLVYGELNCRSNRLARHLRTLGVGHDVCVGVLMERSLDLPVALLAVLKAGGAFVPLDPEYPKDRLAYMLADSAAPVVLTQSWLGERLPEDRSVQYICMDSAWETLGPQAETNLDTQASPDHLAYVIYTSGSTGRPKGVELLHRGLSNHTTWVRNCLDIRPEDRMLQCNSISFDGTLVEFFAPLQGGATLVIARPERHRDTQYLAALIAEYQVTLLNFVPSALRSLLAEPSMCPGHVRYVACGGEALTPDLVRRLREVVPGVRLGNFYGPTETTMNAMYFEVPQDGSPDTVVPIGQPIDNVWCEVRDDHGHPAAPGVVGELYIGGAGVARSYLNQPGLTAERFIVDPVRAGFRLYRTGDRVIKRPDGQLEFVGRTDAQVKLRGCRVELGEVEAALAAIDGVEDCAAIAREDVAGVTRLVAYLSGERVDVARLREIMRLQLPEHMLPSAYVKLPRLPTLLSGKIDRAQLPAPSRADFAHQAFEAPRGEIEQTIADIWQALLGVGRIGRNDDFFELGGHSLLLITMLQRLRKNELTVDARMAFAHPTLAALAAALAVAPRRAGTGVHVEGVPEGCTAITPAMFPLLDISAQDLERIFAGVPGGASNVQDIYPLVPLQEGMVFHHRLQDQGDSYLSRRVLEFDSCQRLDRFLAALQQVIDRHDAFRTAIFWDGLSRPVQVVLREAKLPVQWINGINGGSGRERLMELTDTRRQRLPLGRAPLFSAFTTPDVGGDGWTLALLTHHIVCDRVSEDLLWEEIAAILAGDAGLPQPVPFRSLVRQVLAAVPDAAHAYFQRELGDVSEPTVPFGLSDVRGDGNQVSDYRVTLEPHVAARVRAAARAGGVSAAVLFHVAWAMVLARCCNSEDIVFGTVLSGRLAIDSDAGNRMGLYINTLPLRVDLKGRPARETVQSVHACLAELVEHEHSSLVLAQACSAVQSSSPLFTSVLNYRHSKVGAFDPSTGATTLPGLDGVVLVADPERTNYPVVLAVDQYSDGYAITAQCVPGADPVRLASYMLTAVEVLASALDTGGDAVVEGLDILPPDERTLLTIDYCAGAPVGEGSVRIVEQVAAQMERSPEAWALRFNDLRLSYRELGTQVNRAARVLRNHGVGRGSRVGLCLSRSQDMVVALLAILRAGGAYVPLDPEYPVERLEFMACDADLELMVVGAGPLPMKFPSDRTLRVADLTAGADGCSGAQLAPDSERDARKEDAAYVIYTSGSTGTPKGVVVAHGAMENFLASMSREPGLGCSDRLVAVTTLSFDIAALELLLPLCVGAEVVLASRATAVDGSALRLLLESSEATVMQATPSTWRLLIEAGWRGAAGFKAMVGGEALAGELAGQLLDRSGELWNMYGPTETTVWSSCWRVRADRPMSIGRPIANTCIHVLDRKMRPCPIGVPGEIHIGGSGVALGYHNRADLTAERFLVDPFDPAAGARLYRTGDRGRWCADGLLEHMGRLDLQIKLRGYRIEPGEIEAVLATHPQVLHAVVQGDDTLGDARLLAYVVPASDEPEPEPSELRAHLRKSLPEYMLPQHIIFLSRLPLAPNGKLDRAALPAPYQDSAEDYSFKAPCGELEVALANIWQELLGIDRVGRHDNFFDLGGHSLLAMRLITKIESSTGCRITLLQLASGSVHSIAQHITASSEPKGDVRPGMGAWLGGWLRRLAFKA